MAPAPSLSAALLSNDHRAMTPPAVAATIAVPLHNHARYVGELLESLFEQWRPEFELILIDDASVDDGFLVVQEILAQHPEVRAVVMRTETAEGMGLINHILRFARGEVVIRADSDDVALPGRLETIMACFASDANCRLVTTNAQLISADSRTFGLHDTRAASTVLNDPTQAAAVVGDQRWLGATMAYHREVYDRFPPLDVELCPYGLDLLLPFRAVLLGSHHYLAEPFVGWRQHGTNTHRTLGHYDISAAAQERYQALHLMVLAQKARDAAFLAREASSPRREQALSLCQQLFDAQFADWCRLRSRGLARDRGGDNAKDGGVYQPAMPPIPTLAEGETLLFTEGGTGSAILPHHAGFHRPEHWGTWTERVAHLSLRVVVVPSCAIYVVLRLVAPHLTANQRVSIRVGARGWMDFDIGSARPCDVHLHCEYSSEARNIDITLLTRDAIVPAQICADTSDTRLLGVGIISATLSRELHPPVSCNDADSTESAHGVNDVDSALEPRSRSASGEEADA